MAYGKTKMGSVRSSEAGEPKSQSKVNPALSYGQRTGKTYVNKAEPPKKKTPPMRGGTVARSAKPAPPKKLGGR